MALIRFIIDSVFLTVEGKDASLSHSKRHEVEVLVEGFARGFAEITLDAGMLVLFEGPETTRFGGGSGHLETELEDDCFVPVLVEVRQEARREINVMDGRELLVVCRGLHVLRELVHAGLPQVRVSDVRCDLPRLLLDEPELSVRRGSPVPVEV